MKSGNINLYSKTYQVSKLLDELKKNSKLYRRLCETLNALGNFTLKYEVNIYDISKNDQGQQIITAWISDDNEDVFVFNLKASSKEELLKITKIGNTELVYDGALGKSFPINSENIGITRCKETYNVKYGRLVTDSKSFYTLFLGNDEGYQINGDFNSNMTLELIERINNQKEKPSIMSYVNMFEQMVEIRKIHFTYATIIGFKNMEITEKLEVGEKSISASENNKKIIK